MASVIRRNIDSKKRQSEMNAQDIALIDVSLTYWARWARTQKNFGLGFPSETRERKLMRHGVHIHKVHNVKIPDDEEAEKIEKAIQIMPSTLKKVVIKHYMGVGSVSQKARELNMSRVTFHEYLRMAKYWLLGKWS